MSFENTLEQICHSLQILCEETKQSSGLKELKFCIIELLKAHSFTFSYCFLEMIPTDNCVDRLKMKSNTEVFLKIRLPNCDLRPMKCPQSDGINISASLSFSLSPIWLQVIQNNCIDSAELHMWMQRIFQDVFSTPGRIFQDCKQTTYKLKYKFTGMAHNIQAVDTKRQKPSLSIDFLPVFGFDQDLWPYQRVVANTWYAVPCAIKRQDATDACKFFVSVPLFKNKQKSLWAEDLKTPMRLIMALRDANKMPQISSSLLGTVVLQELAERKLRPWHGTLGQLLMKLLGKLVAHFKDNELPFYWNETVNQLESLNCTDRYNYKVKLQSCYQQLDSYQRQQCLIPFDDLARLFLTD